MKIIIDTGQDGKVINARVRQKTATLSQWLDKDPVILDGEQAFIIRDDGTPLNFRIGDGSKRFSELPDWVAYEQGTYVPVAGSALPTLGAEIRYTWVGPGTYTQSGGPDIIVPSGNMGVLSWDGSVWSLSQSVEMPPLPNEIVDLTVINGESIVYSDFEEARLAVPQELRKGGMILSYLTPSGRVYEKLERDFWSISDSSWRRVDLFSEFRFVSDFDGFIYGNNGELRHEAEVNSSRSKYILLDNMTLHNLSVLSAFSDANGFKAVFVYDDGFNYLGSLYEQAANTYTKSYEINSSEVLSLYPTAKYIACNCPTMSGFNVVSENPIRVYSEKHRESFVSGKDFNEYGYIHKGNGILASSSGYRSTKFIEYNGGFIRITGFSGADRNDAALIAMYDEKGVFLDSIVRPSFGNLSNVTIPASEIHEDTVFIRATRGIEQPNGYLYNYGCKVNKVMEALISAELPEPNNIFELSDPKKAINFNNYLGNTENIHPKVLYFREGWKGFKFWMAYTPYPGGSTLYENPAIAVSNDGLNWSLPSGAPNPLDEKPSYGYNSDTHLVYRDDLDILEVYYRPVNVALNKSEIKVIRFDGSSWTSPEIVLGVDDEQMLSPAILWEDGIYKWYYCKSGSFKVHYAESPANDVGALTNISELNLDFGVVRPWHIDVIRTEKGVEMAIQGFRPSLGEGNNSSDLYYVCQNNDGTFSDVRMIIPRAEISTDLDFTGIYRASILLINQIYYVYYSFLDAVSKRGIALKFGRNIDNLRAV